MKEIETRDGSITFLNEKFGETYHSITVGALEEARVKYVEPANIKEGDNILDFCFGLGYNTIAALKICENITITGIEIDKEILNRILTNSVPNEYTSENETVSQALQNTKKEDKKINIIIGDAMNEIKRLPSDSFNAIFFDPFSPGKHKEIWSLDVFKECFRVMKTDGRLTTYSCATWIRNNLREVGFEVIDGPIFGRKSASTVAIKK
jgi:uncharacterized protein